MRATAWLCLCTCILGLHLAACGPDDAPPNPSPTAVPRVGVGADATFPETKTLPSLDPLAASVLRARNATPATAYHLAASPAGAPTVATGHCRAQRMALRFDSHGPTLTLEGGDVVSLRLVAIGRGATSTLDEPAEVTVENHEARYGRGELVEWYRNGPAGLEQGFDLPQRPPGAADEPLVLTIALSGSLAVEAGRRSVQLVDGEGIVRARYGALFVADANDDVVPSHLEVTGAGEVRLVIDDAEARYPLVVDPLAWVEQDKFVSADVAQHDKFGRHVSLSGDTIAVGVPGDDDAGASSGSVYVFVLSGGVWTQQQKITAFDAATTDEFGAAVAVDGDTLVVGAYRDDDGGDSSGSAYVYTRTGTTWSLEQKLTASDADSFDSFGFSVAIQADTAVIGASNPNLGNPGAAYVFSRSGTTWTEQQTLTPSDPGSIDRFGAAVSLSGTSMVIGAPSKGSVINGHPGAAYAFVESGGIWTQEQKLLSSDMVDNGKFGEEISLSGDSVVISARGDDFAGSNTGSAYVFVRSAGTWTEQQKLTASNAAMQDSFASGVSLEGDTAIVGASNYGNNGAVFVFSRTNGLWTETQKLEASEGIFISFGSAVDFEGNRLAVGAVNADLGGAVYVAELLEVGQSCTTPGDCPSGFCVDGVCCNTACGGGDDSDCQGCAAALTGGADGSCAPLLPNTECRAAAGVCDVVEVCDGTNTACPVDQNASGTVCRSQASACDAPEICSASSVDCPPDAPSPAGTTCRHAFDSCDIEEVCDGVSFDCAADEFVADGTPCDDAFACTEGDACLAGACEPGVNTCEGASGSGGDGGGSDETGGDDDNAAANADEGGCSCRAAGHGAGGPNVTPWLILLGLWTTRRRSRASTGH